LIVTASGASILHRELIVTRAAGHKLPAVYWGRAFVADGGLVSYAADEVDQYPKASRANKV
jgi:putative tryptophan/tyrosine transport system substrate-binding protein